MVADGSEHEQDGYSADTIHHILRNKRRRAVLFYLKYRERETTMRDLTREIAAWECGISPEEVTSKQRERVYVSLHQTHLPTLHEQGIIDYDSDRGTVVAADGLERFEPYIDPKNMEEGATQLAGDAKFQTVYAGIERNAIEQNRKNKILKRLTPRIDETERWSTYYLIAAGLSAISIWLASPLSPVQIPMVVAAVTQTGMFAALAFIHAFVEADPDEVVTAEQMFLGSLRPEWAERD